MYHVELTSHGLDFVDIIILRTNIGCCGSMPQRWTRHFGASCENRPHTPEIVDENLPMRIINDDVRPSIISLHHVI